MWKCAILLWGLMGWMADAQTLNVLPPATGGDPVGIWEADREPLQVFIPPELLAAISTFTLNGTLSGKMTLDAGGGFVTDYVVTTSVRAVAFIPIEIDRIDTTQSEGTYRVVGTDLILESQTTPVVRDTLGFSVQGDDLLLFTNPGDDASLITRLIPGARPPIPILKFIRTGMPDTPDPPDTPAVALTADFDGNGAVDFGDFLTFAQQFGQGT